MVWIVEVGYKKGVTDPVGFLTKKEIDDLNIHDVKEVKQALKIQEAINNS